MKHIQRITVAKASTNDNSALGNIGFLSYIWGIVFFLKQWF